MKKIYLITQQDIDWSWNRFKYKGFADSLCHHDWDRIKKKQAKGYIPLWDRNTQKFSWFKIIEQCKDKLAYVAEGRVSTYWKNTLDTLDTTSKGVDS